MPEAWILQGLALTTDRTCSVTLFWQEIFSDLAAWISLCVHGSGKQTNKKKLRSIFLNNLGMTRRYWICEHRSSKYMQTSQTRRHSTYTQSNSRFFKLEKKSYTVLYNFQQGVESINWEHISLEWLGRRRHSLKTRWIAMFSERNVSLDVITYFLGYIAGLDFVYKPRVLDSEAVCTCNFRGYPRLLKTLCLDLNPFLLN